jgi:hypothetical protein
MTQLNTNTPIRRAGGGIDVYTGLLLAVVLILVVGVFIMARANIEHSEVNGQGGGMFKLVD